MPIEICSVPFDIAGDGLMNLCPASIPDLLRKPQHLGFSADYMIRRGDAARSKVGNVGSLQERHHIRPVTKVKDRHRIIDCAVHVTKDTA